MSAILEKLPGKGAGNQPIELKSKVEISRIKRCVNRPSRSRAGSLRSFQVFFAAKKGRGLKVEARQPTGPEGGNKPIENSIRRALTLNL